MENKRFARAQWLYFVFFFFFLLIISWIVYLQYFWTKPWLNIVEKRNYKKEIVEPWKGDIYDNQENLLVTSVRSYDLHFDACSPEKYESCGLNQKVFRDSLSKLSKKLSKYFGRYSPNHYKNIFLKAKRKGNRYALIEKGLSKRQLEDVQKFPIFNLPLFQSGLVVHVRTERAYVYDFLARRTIGYFKNRGLKVGLEGFYHNYLKGEKGIRVTKKIPGGKFIPIKSNKNKSVKHGYDLHTNIELLYQEIVENILTNQVVTLEADYGSVILMEVKTGKVLAISNIKRENKTDYNYAVKVRKHPGSTFKLATLIAALEEGGISINNFINVSGGKVSFYGHQIKDETYLRDSITLGEAFKISSNVAFTKTAVSVFGKNRKSEKKFINRLYQMKLGERSGIDIGGEPKPFINPIDGGKWSGLSLPLMSIGYEVEFTPLQILKLYNAIANNGVLMRPFLTSSIRDSDKVILKNTAINEDEIASKSISKIVKKLLREVITEGSAKHIQSPIVSIAGKTGTAQISSEGEGYKDKEKIGYSSMFAGFFPAENPKYSAIVVINKPKTKYYAGVVAAPVFKELAEKVSLYDDAIRRSLKKKTEYSMIYTKSSQSEALNRVFSFLQVEPLNKKLFPSLVSIQSHETKYSANDVFIKKGVMPNLKGFSPEKALFILESLGKKVILRGKGVVSEQSEQFGTPLDEIDNVFLTLK